MDNIGNFVNQMRFNRTREEDMRQPIEWLTQFVLIRNKSLSTVLFNALKYVIEVKANNIVDAHIEHFPGHEYHARIYYTVEGIIEDPRDGQPISVENL